MRILLLTQWKPARGGVVTHVEQVIKRLPHEFIIITYPRLPKIPLLRATGFLFFGFFRALRYRDCDIIHAHYAVPQGLLGALLSRVLRLPLVVTVHGSDLLRLAKHPAGRVLVRFVLNEADAVVAVSSFLKQRAMELGVNTGKLRVIYGGVELPEKVHRHRGQRVLFVGSLVRHKGVDVLLRAFRIVKQRLPETELIIVGDGRDRQKLEELCRALELRDVRFEGEQCELSGYYSSSRVLALPSRTEGFGLAALEAMAHSLPVVAARVGGIPEVVVHRETGILVERDNPEALAEALAEVLTDDTLWRRLSSQARRQASGFSWERTAQRYAELYEELV